jgi:N-acyl-D-amino-acid deacylase
MQVDIVIKNGWIIDGTGKDRYKANVLIKDGFIIGISDSDTLPDAGTVIDVDGKIVAPGFIDSHTHSDLMLLWDRQHAAGLQQGITTEIMGQDGISYAPLQRDNIPMYVRFLAGLNGCPDIQLDWSTVSEFRMKFDRTTAINSAYQVPHGALRLETLGMRDLPLTGKHLDKAKSLLEEGLNEGAVAFSTGLSYYPCSYSDTEEMVQLCKVVAAQNSVYVTHIRTVFRETPFDAVVESIEIAKRSGAKLHFSHYRTNIPKAGKVYEIMKDIDEAYQRGVDITLELYPYPSGSGCAIIWLPLWCFEGGYDLLMEQLDDPKLRPVFIKGILENTIPCMGYFTHLPKHPQYIGRTFMDVAKERGQSVPDLLCDLLLAEHLQVGYHDSSPTLFEEATNWEPFNRDCLELLSRPYYMVGSDSIPVGKNPHPRGFGTFPRLLRFCREYGFRLETMINRMTQVPADRFGLKNRGRLAVDYAADIVVFDQELVTDTATYQHSRSAPTGISHVLVNGEIAVYNEKVTGVFAGRALKREAL